MRTMHTRRAIGAPILAPLLLLLLASLGGLVGCTRAMTSRARANQGAPTPSATNIPATTEGRLTLDVRQAVGAAATAVALTYTPATGEISVNITLVWKPAWKLDFKQAQAQAMTVCFAAQRALWTSGVALQQVTVTALGQAPDDYDNLITAAYAAATLTSAHASAIVWSASTPFDAWPRYDNTFLRPTYVPDWVYPPPAIQELTPTPSFP